jgi:hypothetical protein
VLLDLKYLNTNSNPTQFNANVSKCISKKYFSLSYRPVPKFVYQPKVIPALASKMGLIKL